MDPLGIEWIRNLNNSLCASHFGFTNEPIKWHLHILGLFKETGLRKVNERKYLFYPVLIAIVSTTKSKEDVNV